ncbi:unnamed protein product, partial [Mesorhabditis spiculigera]
MVANDTKEVKEGSIAGSLITWQMLEQDMQKAFGTTAITGPKRDGNMMAAGNGFLSNIALVKFDWSHDTDILPERAVLKITACEKLYDMAQDLPNFKPDEVWGNCKAVNDNELSFYQNCEKVWKMPKELMVAKFYCGREFGLDGVDAGYFAIEFFDKAESRHFYNNVQESSVKEILDQLVLINTHSLKHPELFENYTNEHYINMMSSFCTEESVTKSIEECLEKHPDLEQELLAMQKMAKYFETFTNFDAKMAESCNNMRMFCHGDMWLGNMLWQKDARGDYRMKRLIDWQLHRWGTPMEDLARLLTSAFSADEYQNRKQIYLQYYYDAFLKQMNGGPMPWKSYQDFEENYERGFALCSTAFGPVFLCMTHKILDTIKDEKDKIDGPQNYKDKVYNMVREAARLAKKWNM